MSHCIICINILPPLLGSIFFYLVYMSVLGCFASSPYHHRFFSRILGSGNMWEEYSLHLGRVPNQIDTGSLHKDISIIKHQCDVCVCVLVTQSCPTLCSSMDCSPPGSSVHEFSRQEYWSGLPFHSPGVLPDPGMNPSLLHCRQFLYHLSHQGRQVMFRSLQ